MKNFTSLIAAACLLLQSTGVVAKSELEKCFAKQVKPLQSQHLSFSYREQLNEFYHSPQPWQQKRYDGSGMVWCNGDQFLKQDTLVSGKRILYSKTQFSKDELLYLDYGRKEFSPITSATLASQLWECARYTPMPLIQYMAGQKLSPEKQSDKAFAAYRSKIGDNVVTMYISSSDHLVSKITVLGNDDLYGDVLTSFVYADYVAEGKVIYPKKISIEKTNGKLKDELLVTAAHLVPVAPKLLDRPADYSVKQDIAEQEEIRLEKYNDHIYFLNLLHAGAKTMIVVFKDFLLVAEAPLNNKNGELIISEAQKIAPGKPIRYFTFGHHHPHYLGGMRAFIHKGATVLSVKSDEDYIRYLAGAPHSLMPDSLQYQPKQVSIEEINDSKTITDGSFQMQIHFVGKQSEHTEDYLVYYFPEERLLFEGDLVWVNKNGKTEKAGPTQAGLYQFITDHKLPVDTIIQSWGISFENYKTTIPFSEVAQSMSIK
jgi:glyoxylase-like metal-dependent hydrolase (beta-lactamase superfamily II)